MPHYLIQASYTAEAAAAFASKPQDRGEGVRALIERMGGQLESFYYSLGDYDVMSTYSAPDDATALAIAMAALSPGHLRSFKTTKLLTADEFLEASRKAGSASYQGPSRG